MFKWLCWLVGCMVLAYSVPAQAQPGWEVVEIQDFKPVFEKITQGKAVDYSLALSADQTRFAWLSAEDQLCIHTFAQNQTTCTVLPAAYGKSYPYTNLFWSPDQAYLAITAKWIFINQPAPNVWLYSTRDDSFTNLTHNTENEMQYQMQWSVPDGILYVVGYQQAFGDNGWDFISARLYRLLPGKHQLESIFNLPRLIKGTDLVSAAVSPDGQRLALLGASLDADRLYGGLWIIDIRGKTMEQAAAQNGLRVGLPAWYLYDLIPQQVIWNEAGLFITLGGLAPFVPIGVVVIYFNPDQKTLVPLFDFMDLTEDNLFDFSHGFPLTGQVTNDGHFFVYVTITEAGSRLWMLPLPPDGSQPVLAADPFDLDCGSTYTRITIRQEGTIHSYLPHFWRACGE